MDNEKQTSTRGRLIGGILLVSLIPALANYIYMLIEVNRCARNNLSTVPCGEGIIIWAILIIGLVVGVIGSLVGYIFKRDKTGIIIGGLLGGLILILAQILL